jgi:hypothetical protein
MPPPLTYAIIGLLACLLASAPIDAVHVKRLYFPPFTRAFSSSSVLVYVFVCLLLFVACRLPPVYTFYLSTWCFVLGHDIAWFRLLLKHLCCVPINE